MSAAKTDTPIALSCSARSCSVTVLPVPVAPAMRPCRLHMAAESCTTAVRSVVPSIMPRPSITDPPLDWYAALMHSPKSVMG